MAYTMWEGGVLIPGGSACHYETMQFVADTGLAGEMGTAYHGLSYISYGIAKAFSDGWVSVVMEGKLSRQAQPTCPRGATAAFLAFSFCRSNWLNWP